MRLWLFFSMCWVPSLATNGMEPLFTWARSKGVYIHPCVEYRNNGMFANCTIGPDTDLVRVPSDLYIPVNESSWEPVAEKLVNGTIDSRFDVYVQSLPKTCQIPMCNPLNVSQLTLGGQTQWRTYVRRFETWSHAKKIAWSIIQSRSWSRGLIPVVDLFNHDRRKGLPLQRTTDGYAVKTSNEWAFSGDELFDNYGFASTWKGYLNYGFVDEGVTPTCRDARLLRFQHNPRMRVNCIANMSSTFDRMVHELTSAHEQDDLCMLKGSAQWIDDYIIYGSDTDEE